MEMERCKLVNGRIVVYRWLPRQFAQVGKRVELRMGQNWESGWVVEDVLLGLAESGMLVREPEGPVSSEGRPFFSELATYAEILFNYRKMLQNYLLNK